VTRTCRTCGSIYTDSAGGRHTHKVLFGHAPTPEKGEKAGLTWENVGTTAERPGRGEWSLRPGLTTTRNLGGFVMAWPYCTPAPAAPRNDAGVI
jgi:hypothetical protein